MRETRMRIALVAAGLVLVGATTTACGGGADDAPDSASKKDFCEVFEKAPDGKPSQDELDEFVENLEDTGTPDDISDDERHGYEVLVETLKDVDVDDVDEEDTFEDLVAEDDDRADVTEFLVYYAQKCIGGLPGTTETPEP